VTGVTAVNKVFDGTTSAQLGGSAAVAAIGLDAVTIAGPGVGAFANAVVGNAKSVSVTGFTLGGLDAANYAIVQPLGLVADITASAVIPIVPVPTPVPPPPPSTAIALLTPNVITPPAATAGEVKKQPQRTSDGIFVTNYDFHQNAVVTIVNAGMQLPSDAPGWLIQMGKAGAIDYSDLLERILPQ
jgi:hypothetical protein